MKYKFLLRLYKDSRKEIKVVIKYQDLLAEIKDRSYQLFYKSVFVFKSKNKGIDCSCLDTLLDKCYLTGDLLSNNIDKEYNALRGFIKGLTVHDFKVLHKFRLYLETEIVMVMPQNADDVEENMLLTYLSTVVFVCEGGILYLPMKYRNCTVNIGKALDSLVDIKRDSVKHPLIQYDQWVLDKLIPEDTDVSLTYSQKILFINDIIKSLVIKEISSGLGVYYNYLLNLAFALDNLSIRNLIENYIHEDVFKYNAGYFKIYSKEQPSLVQRFRLAKKHFKNFYNRKVILPSSGIFIKVTKEKDSKVLACESNDDIFGRRIFWFIMSEESKFYHIDDIHLETGYGTMFIFFNGSNSVLDVLGIANLFANDVVEFDGIALMIDKSDMVTCYRQHKYSEVDSLQYEVYQPNYWKYRGNGGNGNVISNNIKGTNKLYAEEIKKLSPFKRNLPDGQTRSPEATTLAKKLCINLADNETVVGEFERKQRVRIDTKMSVF